MGLYLVAIVYGIPCFVFILYCLTPSGKRWLRKNNMV